jgi:hypothetical protein
MHYYEVCCLTQLFYFLPFCREPKGHRRRLLPPFAAAAGVIVDEVEEEEEVTAEASPTRLLP